MWLELKHPLFIQHLSNDHNGGGGGVDAATANDDYDDGVDVEEEGVVHSDKALYYDDDDNGVDVEEEGAVHSDKALYYDDGDNGDDLYIIGRFCLFVSLSVFMVFHGPRLVFQGVHGSRLVFHGFSPECTRPNCILAQQSSLGPPPGGRHRT